MKIICILSVTPTTLKAIGKGPTVDSSGVPIQAFQHFVATKENCVMLEQLEFDAISAFKQEDFRELVLNVDPDEMEMMVVSYLDRLWEEEVQKLVDVYMVKKQKVIDALKNEVFLNALTKDYSQRSFKKLYEENLSKQTLAEHKPEFEKIVGRMKQLDQKDYLYKEIQLKEGEQLALPYFENKEAFKVTLEKELTENISQENDNWRRKQEEYKYSRETILKYMDKHGLQRNHTEDYVVFQDYELVKGLEQSEKENGEFIFW